MVAATMAVLLAWALSACSFLPSLGQGDALEKYADAERSQLPSVMEANPGVFSDIQVEAIEPATIAFTFTYADVMDATATSSNLDGLAPDLQDACDTSVFPAMRSAGVEGDLQVSYTYLNNDGSEIWTRSFTES